MSKILYCVTEDWFFASHFLPMARAARELGFDVVVATRVAGHAEQIAAEGIRIIPLNIERRSLAPLDAIRHLAASIRIIRAEDPDIVHCIALRPILLGGLAAKLASVRNLVLAPTGLGHLWIENGFVVRVLRAIIRFVIGRWLRGPRTHYLFENADDPREFGLDPNNADLIMVGGAGVDPSEFPLAPEPPAPPLKVAVVSRMLITKGVAEAVAAAGRARALGASIELHLFGDPDPSNWRSISEATLRDWATRPGIAWHGRSNDVARVWREHHVALLLSYREGLPRSLVEAAAVGRPIVTSAVPGCREVVRDDENGFLVPLGDVEQAATALLRLANEPDLRARMGAASHERFRERFTDEAVRRVVGRLYQRLTKPAGGPVQKMP